MNLIGKLPVVSYLKRAVSLDLRSLALLRIGLGVTIILDLGARIPDLAAFYSDRGILPVSDFFYYTSKTPWVISFHALSGDPGFQTVLFAAGILIGACLVMGWHTRLFTLLSFIFLTSLDNRNTLILNNGDLQLRLILFWGIFLPLGAKFSIDALNKRPEHKPYFSPASASYYIQIFCIYFFAGLHKLFSPVWQQGQGLFMALSQESTATPAAIALRSYPDLLYFPNFIVILIEIICPVILLFSPSVKMKSVMLCLLIFLQASFFIFLSLGFFPWISIICLSGLLPGAVWEIRQLKVFSKYMSQERIKGRTKSTVSVLPFTKTAMDTLIIFLITVTLWTNMSTVKLSGNMLPELITVAKYLQIYQSWGMFSFFPDTDKGFYILQGNLQNGETADLYKDRPWQNYTPPPHSKYHSYNRWSVFFLHYLKNPWHARHFAGYLCNQYNSSSKENPLTGIQISYFIKSEVNNLGLYGCLP